MDYMGTEQMLGIQAAHEGALLIEGTWYCPSMPKMLQTATFDHQLRAKDDPERLTDEEYAQRIAQRDRYRLRNKEHPDADGYTRKMCPAAGPSATVACPLQIQHPKAAGKTGLTPILKVNLIHPAPKVCSNQSTLTFPPTAGAKYEQALPVDGLARPLHPRPRSRGIGEQVGEERHVPNHQGSRQTTPARLDRPVPGGHSHGRGHQRP